DDRENLPVRDFEIDLVRRGEAAEAHRQARDLENSAHSTAFSSWSSSWMRREGRMPSGRYRIIRMSAAPKTIHRQLLGAMRTLEPTSLANHFWNWRVISGVRILSNPRRTTAPTRTPGVLPRPPMMMQHRTMIE